MPTDRPVVFLAFANEQEGRRDLRKLPEETRELRSILQEADDRGLCKLEVRTNATLADLDEVFRRYGSRVAIFHFGGHADAERLLLESASGAMAAHAEGLAGYLGGQGGVKLVFLNACSTRPQVADLLLKGIDLVLATARPIGDDAAREFAANFYRQLVSGRTFRDAFEHARELAKTARGRSPEAFVRSLGDFGGCRRRARVPLGFRGPSRRRTDRTSTSPTWPVTRYSACRSCRRRGNCHRAPTPNRSIPSPPVRPRLLRAAPGNSRALQPRHLARVPPRDPLLWSNWRG